MTMESYFWSKVMTRWRMRHIHGMWHDSSSGHWQILTLSRSEKTCWANLFHNNILIGIRLFERNLTEDWKRQVIRQTPYLFPPMWGEINDSPSRNGCTVCTFYIEGFLCPLYSNLMGQNRLHALLICWTTTTELLNWIQSCHSLFFPLDSPF